MSQRPKPIFVRAIKILFLFCLAFYLSICAFMAFSQRSLIYHPKVFATAQVDEMARSANLERWTNAAGQFIGFKRLSPRQPAEGTVLLTYGNAATATGSAHYANDIQSAAAFDVYILEYPGYEDRPGTPTQKNLFSAARDGFQMLPTNQPVYLAGESLGSGVASYLAGTFSNKVSGVILISPFNRLTSVAQYQYPWLPVWFLMVDRFPSEKYLRQYHGRLGVTVDGRDNVVPEKFGRRLYNGYDGPKKLWEFPDGGHCQILMPPSVFWREVVDFWRQ